MQKSSKISFILGPLVSIALGGLTIASIAYVYSPNEIGMYSMLLVASNFVLMIGTLGLDQAYIRDFNETKNKSSILVMSMVPGALILVISTIFLFLFTPYFLSSVLYDKNSTYLSALTALALSLIFINKYQLAAVRMYEKSFGYIFANNSQKLILIILVIIYWVEGNLGVEGIITSIAVSFLFSVLFNSLVLKGTIDPRSIKWNSAEFKKLLQYGLPLLGESMGYWVLISSGAIILRNYSSYSELGVYGLALSIAASCGVAGGGINTIFSNSYYKLLINTPDGCERYTKNVMHLIGKLSQITLIILVILLYLIYFFIDINEKYKSVFNLLPICLVPQYLYVVTEITSIGISASRKTYLTSIANIITAAFNIFILLYAANIFNLDATIVATASSMSFFIFLISKTEFSNYAWKKIDTKMIYCQCFFLEFIALIYTYRDTLPKVIYEIWLLALFLYLIYLIYKLISNRELRFL